jgi:DNA-binding response OmpR family regulator
LEINLKKILCIEDEPEMAALLEEDLSERGYIVSLASDAEKALHKLLSDPPSLILCDIGLPSISGYELLKRILSDHVELSRIPFIFLTALTDRESELMGRNLGVDDYVTKPVDFDILASIIKVRIARSQSAVPLVLKSNLSGREIEVLTWSAKGKTSDEIASILHLTKRTIDFHIDNAREKLGASTRTQAAIKAAAEGLIIL